MSDWEVIQGDCIEAMAKIPDASIDAIVTDPPYGIGFMGHDWDQPGEFGPVRSNGEPGPFASGRPYPGKHVAGGREGTPSGQRRASNPKPSGYEKRQGVRMGGPTGADNTTHSLRGGAMHAGRYDLSRTANQRYQAWCEAWARECLRVLKPGGHLLASCGTRTYHRLVAGVEDAGFEIRDSLIWLYGSGFPKSLNVAKAIDKAERGVPQGGTDPTSPNHGRFKTQASEGKRGESDKGQGFGAGPGAFMAEEGETEDRELVETARPWEGWGTALKPSHEPILVARKPLIGTVAANVSEHGTGGINIDACRVGDGADKMGSFGRGLFGKERCEVDTSIGRWPGNVVLSHTPLCELVGYVEVDSDGHFPAERGPSGYGSNGSHPDSTGGGLKGETDLEERSFRGETIEAWDCAPGCPVASLNAQSGELTSGTAVGGLHRRSNKTSNCYGRWEGERTEGDVTYGDSGGAARFFYCAKTSRSERNAGLGDFASKPLNWSSGDQSPGTFQSDGTDRSARNYHPTVKPIALMRWLCRLVTPRGGGSSRSVLRIRDDRLRSGPRRLRLHRNRARGRVRGDRQGAYRLVGRAPRQRRRGGPCGERQERASRP